MVSGDLNQQRRTRSGQASFLMAWITPLQAAQCYNRSRGPQRAAEGLAAAAPIRSKGTPQTGRKRAAGLFETIRGATDARGTANT